ncbi:uncharacterized protein TM35_000171550 [Trypanosoma theileri]|uniref:Protein root UVB sensitive/RUS domain-containing protein n=1 Tax=Trypanosoma theileri TaxID=67003 RepID=A0A1X0NUW8_9TRYP|nr:uncharacterized protein TM35_000171550 [Trypanosoma theileri]ORC88283.1 hypothetical protein TM35_000171550 [Trypanosoma theileri]
MSTVPLSRHVVSRCVVPHHRGGTLLRSLHSTALCGTVMSTNTAVSTSSVRMSMMSRCMYQGRRFLVVPHTAAHPQSLENSDNTHHTQRVGRNNNGSIGSSVSKNIINNTTTTTTNTTTNNNISNISTSNNSKKNIDSNDNSESNKNSSSSSIKNNTDISKKLSTMGFSQCKRKFTWKDSETKPGVVRLVSSQEMSFLLRLRFFGMPQGYPNTCAVGFRRYFLLSMCSSSMSSFSSSIGYQSILNGFFLGSSPQLWMMKDLLPALAAAYMANRIISYENRPKFWFLMSVVMHNLSVLAEMVIPSLVPHHLLITAVVTSCMRQSASLMFLVTRACALQHFAVSNNLAELTKKFNSFGMVIYTIFTALGIAYTSVVTSLSAQLLTVLFCCGLNLVISYMSMSNIAFRVLNITTLSVVLREYVGKCGKHSRRIPTPEEVSRLIGVSMVDRGAVTTCNDRTCLLYVSPPVCKLRIRADRLNEDVVYVCKSEMFLLALWEPLGPLSLRESWLRWEAPHMWRRLFARSSAARREARIREKFRKRLVLLVHQDCDQLHLLTAYLLAYTALLYHSNTVSELCSFLRSCHNEQALWLHYARELRDSLHHVGWDVEQLSLDPPDFRLSNLHFARGLPFAAAKDQGLK